MKPLPFDLSKVDPKEIEPHKQLDLGNGYYLFLEVHPDFCWDFSDFECYGKVQTTADRQRPAGFDGSAEVVDRNRDCRTWWLPYREGRKVYNSPADRRLVTDLLEFGTSYLDLALYGPAKSIHGIHTVDIAHAAIGCVEPFSESEQIPELLAELACAMETI